MVGVRCTLGLQMLIMGEYRGCMSLISETIFICLWCFNKVHGQK